MLVRMYSDFGEAWIFLGCICMERGAARRDRCRIPSLWMFSAIYPM
jgi:hypothetical protein